MSRLLETIDSPADLKALPLRDLPKLAAEIREELVGVVAKLGGHLASSLGAVELCLALHYVFDAPDDQLVWDMGYQAYAHKLLTGRRARIGTLKQFRGLSGFCNKDESPYDLFTTGHGGTCLSTAMGLAVARDRAGTIRAGEGVARRAGAAPDQGGEPRRVAAIIGDASLGEGMALEALNHIGHVKPNLLVILNDNKMSISQPVGGLSKYLNRIITDPLYNRLHEDLQQLVAKLPKGQRLVRLGQKVEESLKGFVTPGLLFEELGFRYVGPVDGHNIPELVTTLQNVKRLKGPTLLHVLTLKGKGYAPAEQDPERFHKTEPFDVKTGQPKGQGSRVKVQGGRPRTSNLEPRTTFTDAFSDALIELAQQDARVIGMTAAMPEGTGMAAFGRRFPDRYFDVGMAEQHGIGLAAGLARAGRRPVVAIYSTFLQRAYDQIMHEMCLQNLPVILAIDRAGLVGEDGPTHHGVFDLAYLRVFPNLTVMSPKDPEELRAMLRWAMARPGEPEGRAGGTAGPVAIRYARGGILCGEPLGRPSKLSLGKSEVLRQGGDLAILALGSLVYPALEVAGRLKRDGLEAAVVNARFVKPLDAALIRQLAAQTGALVTLEEAQIAGGFGSAVSEALEAMGLATVPLCRIGLPDAFVEHGRRDQLLTLCQLDPNSLTPRISAWYSALKISTERVGVLSSPE
ncbi:MAG: 1-deoxy-D-xylulose-5-phosphate synthase [Candidatus Omnitrophica bacterium]|nr:1-deoxy-D-xylulose-5-phosphate synthase [Candidatus Omnitrophota bacterium]